MSKVIYTIVNSCNECPYISSSGYFCDHDQLGGLRIHDKDIPDWCPLEDKAELVPLLPVRCQCLYTCYPKCTNPDRRSHGTSDEV